MGAEPDGFGSNTYTSLPLVTGNNVITIGSTELPQVFPTGGTIDNLQASTTNIGAGQYDISLRQNSATSTLTCTLTNDHCGDTIYAVSVASGDTLSLSFASSSNPTTGFNGGWGTRFVPTTAGDFVFLFIDVNNDTSVSTRYVPVNGTYSGTLVATETNESTIVPATMTMTSMSLIRSAAPGSGKTATVTLRVNGSDSSLTCRLTGTGSVTVNAGDLIDYSLALSSAGTGGTYKIGLLANANTATPPSSTVDSRSNWFLVLNN